MTSLSWLWPTSPRDQSQLEIPPLRDKNVTAGTSDKHAASRRETTSSPVRGTAAWVWGMATLPWPMRHAQDEDRFEDQYPDSAIGASIAGTATGTKAMTSDITSRAESNRRHSHVYGAQVRTAEREARGDQTRVRATSPTGVLQNSKGWRHLGVKRLDLQGIRVIYEEQREKLRMKQQEMHAIDAQFVRKLQKVESVVLEDMRLFVVEILKHYEILQEARSLIAFEEAEYEKIERKLVNGERELRDLESRMYRSSTTDSVGTLEQDNLIAVEEDPTESVVSSQNIRRNQSLEAQRYLSQKGDVDILKEQLMDLRVYQSQVTAEQADRRDAGLDPDEDLTAFLNGFEQQHEALVLRVREAEERLAEYEDALQVPEDRYSPSEGPSRAHSLFGKDDYFDDSVLEAREMEDDRLAATARAFLLSPSESVSVYSLLENETADIPVDKGLYVNSWLLHHLRRSTGEVARLVTEHMNYALQLEPNDFKQQVLANWLQDETVHAFDFSRFAIDSHDYSMATVSGNTQKSTPASENALQGDQQNSFSLQRRLSARQTETER